MLDKDRYSATERTIDRIKEKACAAELLQDRIKKRVAFEVAYEGKKILVKSLIISAIGRDFLW